MLKGLEPLLDQARSQGLGTGPERGLLMGCIRPLQQVLRQPAMSSQELLLRSPEDLQLLATDPESRRRPD